MRRAAWGGILFGTSVETGAGLVASKYVRLRDGDRLFLAEKWLVLKLRYGHANPRDAGVGNIVNCGAAMYIAPVGIANAGDPGGAYLEALELTARHAHLDASELEASRSSTARPRATSWAM